MSRTVIVLIGALALAILTFVCVSNNASDIQADIQARTSNVLSRNTPTSWAKAKVDGRNVILTGVAPSETMRKQAIKIASEIKGVVDVDNRMTVASLASILQSTLSSDNSVNESKLVKSTPEIVEQSEVISTQEQQQQEEVVALAESEYEPQDVVIEKQEIETESVNDHVVQTSLCDEKFNQLVTTQTITFSKNSIDIESQAKVVIYKLLQFAEVCPNSIVEVAGHTDSSGDEALNYRLSKQRAQVVVNVLIKNGMQADKLHMEGYGETRPISTNNTKQGQANNRRIELKYLREGEK